MDGPGNCWVPGGLGPRNVPGCREGVLRDWTTGGLWAVPWLVSYRSADTLLVEAYVVLPSS